MNNLLVYGLTGLFLFCTLLYARQINMAIIFLLVSAILLIIYIEESRIRDCEKNCKV